MPKEVWTVCISLSGAEKTAASKSPVSLPWYGRKATSPKDEKMPREPPLPLEGHAENSAAAEEKEISPALIRAFNSFACSDASGPVSRMCDADAVSYTHLTLPTKRIV